MLSLDNFPDICYSTGTIHILSIAQQVSFSCMEEILNTEALFIRTQKISGLVQ